MLHVFMVNKCMKFNLGYKITKNIIIKCDVGQEKVAAAV